MLGSLCAVTLARVLFQDTCSNVAEIKAHTFQMIAETGSCLTCGWS